MHHPSILAGYRMELRHLRYFATVAEELHFGRAAARLGISQPPLSIQIRQLEQELAVTLFERKRNVALTPAVREFLEHVKTALQQVELGVRSAQRVHRGERGQLNVGFISSMAYTFIPRLLGAFRHRYPDVDLVLNDLDSQTQFVALREGRINVGVVRAPVDEPGIGSVTVYSEPLVVAMPTSHPLGRADRVQLRELAGDRFIMFPRAMRGPLNVEVMRLCQDAGFTPHVAQEAVQLHVVASLVSAGIGIAVVPASTQSLRVPGVVFRPLADRGGQVYIAVAFREGDCSPIVREFVQMARQLFARGLRRALLGDGAMQREGAATMRTRRAAGASQGESGSGTSTYGASHRARRRADERS
jgi:DNA-binding transcriptional LysR family regulator